jgi:TatD DNase family protein
MNIYDSHAHYESDAFDEDRDRLIPSLRDKGIVGIVNCGSDIATSLKSLELAADYDFIYAACGVHPHEASKAQRDWPGKVKELCLSEKCVAVGEIGLDYHYDFSPRETQIKVFEEQVILANELSLPVIVHDREAHEDTFRILAKYRPQGVVHCFSGSAELAKETLKLGMYIGLGGAATFKNARKPLEVAAIVPDDRLLIETDCPYMTPVPFRGRRNDSSYIPYIAEILAQARGTTAEKILEITRANANALFKTEF